MAIAALGGALALRFSSSNAPAAHTKSVIVIPFSNLTGERNLDYLGLALANEISSTLGYTRYLSVRPSELARRYAGSDVNAVQVGHELHAANVITGGFATAGDQLQLTMEMFDVDRERLEWRDTFNVPGQNRLAMQAQVAARIMRGPAQLLGGVRELAGIAQSMRESATQPHNEQAYDLFLRAIALPFDGASIHAAHRMLETSVKLDPDYSPAWAALAGVCLGESWYFDGGPGGFQCALDAMQRISRLDPGNVPVAAGNALLLCEQNQLAAGFRVAREALRRRPDSARVHFAMSYVLRYAGLTTDAERECETVLLLDAQDGGARSCAVAFLLRGDYQRAREYLNLDLGTEWEKALSMDLMLRQGREAEALRHRPEIIPEWAGYGALVAYLEHRPAAEVAKLARSVKPVRDPEVNYFSAAHLAYARQTDAALSMLKQTIDAGYCSWPAVDRDPMLASIRGVPAFAAIRSTAMGCQQKFLIAREQ